MAKLTLTPDQQIAEMNRRLQQHQSYRTGMKFLPYPEGSSGRAMSGYTFTGPFELTGIYAQIAHSVAQEFDLKV